MTTMNTTQVYSRDNLINIRPDTNGDLNIIVTSGPYMPTGSTQTPVLGQLVEVVKAKNPQVLVLVIGKIFFIFNYSE